MAIKTMVSYNVVCLTLHFQCDIIGHDYYYFFFNLFIF